MPWPATEVPLVWLDHLVALWLLVGLPPLAWWQQSKPTERPPEPSERIQGYWANSLSLWISLALPVGLAVWSAGRSVAAIGIGPPRLDAPSWWLLAGIVSWLAVDTLVQVVPRRERRRVGERWLRDTPWMPRDRREVRHGTVLALSAGVCEEVAYRGFLLTYLTAVSGASWVGVVVPSVVFGTLHLYQGGLRAAKTGVLSAALAVLAVATGSIVLPIVVHAAIDLTMNALSPWLLAPPRDD